MHQLFPCLSNKREVDPTRLAAFKASYAGILDKELKSRFQRLYDYLSEQRSFEHTGKYTRPLTNTILDDFTALAKEITESRTQTASPETLKKFDCYCDNTNTFKIHSNLRIAIAGILAVLAVAALATLFIMTGPASLTLPFIGLAIGKAFCITALTTMFPTPFFYLRSTDKQLALDFQKGRMKYCINSIPEKAKELANATNPIKGNA